MTGTIISVCIAFFVLLILALSLNRGRDKDASTWMHKDDVTWEREHDATTWMRDQ